MVHLLHRLYGVDAPAYSQPVWLVCARRRRWSWRGGLVEAGWGGRFAAVAWR